MSDENLKTKLGKEYRKQTIKGEETEVDSAKNDEELKSKRDPQIITNKDLEGNNEENFSRQ